jgi:hypothetical protein
MQYKRGMLQTLQAADAPLAGWAKAARAFRFGTKLTRLCPPCEPVNEFGPVAAGLRKFLAIAKKL